MAQSSKNQRAIWANFGLISLFMGVEYVAGKAFNSLALMADAGHMLNDSLSLGLVLLTLTWAKNGADIWRC